MNLTTTYSTLFLTLLLMVGLFFFIRASTKDRTETLDLIPPAAPELTMQVLTRYFESRAYQLQTVKPAEASLQFTGMVRPSWFLAGFLTFLAAVACLCFALVLASLFPQYGLIFTALMLLAPFAGWFYWRRAGREEQISLTLRSGLEGDSSASNILQITAHRDELIALQQAWNKDRLGQATD
ncbi:MAG: cofactor assembly of complex C subunit B [Nodosilinea sp.]